MDRDLLRLKLALSQHCTELQNLTIKDLQELKWITKQKLVLSLVSKSPMFEGQCEEIEKILEQRNKEVLAQKSQQISRDQKLESDALYRTSILRVFLDCAEILKWPKALEAFSNPLQDLTTDNALFLDCVQYCIRILFPTTMKQNRPISTPNPHETIPIPAAIKSPLTPRNTTPRNTTPRSSIVHFSQDVSGELSLVPSSISSDRDRFDLITQRENVYSNQEASQLQIVLSQNRQLVQELRSLKESLSKRKQLEAKFRSVTQDVITAVEEIASITSCDVSSDKTGKGKTSGNDRPWQALHSRLLVNCRQLDEFSANSSVTEKDFELDHSSNLSRNSYKFLANKSKPSPLTAGCANEDLAHLLQLTSAVIERTDSDELHYACLDLYRGLVRISNGSVDNSGLDASNSAIFTAIEKAFEISGASKMTKDRREAAEESCIQALQEADVLHRKLFLLEKLSVAVRKDPKAKLQTTLPEKHVNSRKALEEAKLAVDAVLTAFQRVSNSKIITKSQQARDPIEMLSRGYMGNELANFVNTFKAHENSLKTFSMEVR